MNITKDFAGGNIEVIGREGNTVCVERELRDTVGDWFYWAFCVDDAEEEEITFKFNKFRLGYYGPAVSRDLRNWQWLGKSDGDSFTYKFADSGKYYFAHHMLYDQRRFFEQADRLGLKINTLCKTKKGRDVPYITFGEGDKCVMLTSRHHACESTGNYVLEGFIENAVKHPLPGYRFFCVPFVDYDGVIDGDQGKNRNGYDHNRDYNRSAPSVYPEVSAIRRYADTHCVKFAFDFHAPWHIGQQNDHAFIPQKSIEKLDRLIKFGKTLENCVGGESLKYEQKNDFPPNKDWNKVGTTNFVSYMLEQPDNDIALTLETTYFGTSDNIFSAEKAVNLGKAFYDAFVKYEKNSRPAI